MYAFFLSHYADPFFILLSAVLLDLVLGDPYAIPHPVKLMGFAVKVEEKLARKAAKTGGGLKVCGLCIACFNTVFVFCLFFFFIGIHKTVSGRLFLPFGVVLLYLHCGALPAKRGL